ncbi:MAG: MarR family transcriptional regulator, partial [Clostridia bacterium]|nr:MarR family transcriptional regulator [Clostridia bacterium]
MDKDSSIGRYLSYIYRAGHCYIGKRLEEFNIGSGQYGLLLLLSKNDGISQESLSDINKLDKATVGRAIKKLENQGYVVRKQDELDKRAYKLYITPKGEKVVPEIR